MARKLPPIHPGEILLEEYLKPLGLSHYRLAKDIGVPIRRVTEITSKRRGVSPDTALRLGRYFGTSGQFWLSIQTRYDLEVAEDILGASLKREIKPLKMKQAA